MITIFAMIIGAAFVYVGIKKKFFVMWAMLFNLIVSIYLSVMLVHAISRATPDIGSNAYFLAGCLLGMVSLIYAILHIIVKMYVIGSNVIEFPMLFDRIGAGILGFIFGYLACCIVLFAIGIMPIAKHEFMTNVLKDKTIASVVSLPIKRVCNFTGDITLQCYPEKGDAVLDWLMTLSDQQEKPKLKSGSARKDLTKELEGIDSEVEPTEEVFNDPNQ